MRLYVIDGEELVLLYRYINNGIEITTKYKNELRYKLYQDINLSIYKDISDLIDDISYSFINYLRRTVKHE